MLDVIMYVLFVVGLTLVMLGIIVVAVCAAASMAAEIAGKEKTAGEIFGYTPFGMVCSVIGGVLVLISLCMMVIYGVITGA